ncbi:hypothetical protein V473_09495 [Sphingobium cupriresistens LL01]|uniref:Uncharacterized protein n=1 Tax=Sphingobium cupriresistens LL01 TaxID=1420583 RepID=A0A0J7Y5A3_9SPHN|nr:hypothetical protein V473_09495 [Sphingobium cupriresistens LL01]
MADFCSAVDTGAGEEGGFFDALANGPVAASDPSIETDRGAP